MRYIIFCANKSFIEGLSKIIQSVCHVSFLVEKYGYDKIKFIIGIRVDPVETMHLILNCIVLFDK